MPGKVLIVDELAVNRIVLKVKLAAAFYSVDMAADADEALRNMKAIEPDIILIGDNLPREDIARLLDQAAGIDGDTAAQCILITSDFAASTRLAALARGATDVLCKPVPDTVLLARLRNLIRRRDRQAEMGMSGENAQFLGFAERASSFEGPAHVALVTPRKRKDQSPARELHDKLQIRSKLIAPADILTSDATEWDVLVAELPPEPRMADLAFLSDLKVKLAGRTAGLILIVPEDRNDLVANAYDLGADDVVTEKTDPREIDLRVATLLGTKRQLDRMRARLRDGLRASVIDPLTGLYNRRFAVPHLRRTLDACGATSTQCAVMLADIDHFKSVNDAHGHTVGDRVLRTVADRLVKQAGPKALVARTGGEEFLIVLPDTSQEAAARAAEAICEAVRKVPVQAPCPSDAIRVTVSVGVTMAGAVDAALPPERVIERADKAMYVAKARGRNRATWLRPAA